MSQGKGIWVDDKTYLNFADTPERAAMTQEIATRQTAWDFSGLIGLLPDPDPVLTKHGSGAEILAGLTADGHVTSVIQTRKVGTLLREIRWQPGAAEGQEPDAQAQAVAAAFGEDMQAIDQEVGLRNIISQILDAPLYGFTPLELKWAPDKGRLRLAGIEAKPHGWFRFNDRNQPRFVSLKDKENGEEIPWGKVVLARHFPTYDNPYGLRLLSRVFWPVTFKRGGMKFWVTFCEKYGIPFLLGRYARGTSEPDQQKMLGNLAAMVQDAVAVVPEGSTVELLGAGGNSKGSSDLFDRLCSVMDKEISKVVVGQTLTAETSDTGGAYAQSKTHQDVLAAYQASDQALVRETMSRIAAIYTQVNSAGAAPPQFAWFEEDDPQQEFAARDKTLKETGVKFAKAYYVRRYGFKEDEIEVVEAGSAGGGGQIYEYDLTNQVATRNERRRSFGLPPRPDGDKMVEVQQPGGKPQFAEQEQSGFTPEQQALEELAAHSLALAGESLATNEARILAAVTTANSYDEAMANLLELYPALDMSGLADLLSRAMLAAELHGLATVKGGGHA